MIVGSYFWLILNAPIADAMIKITFFLSGIVMVGSVYALARAKTRPARTAFTVLSGLVGGAHAYMDVTLYPEWLYGTFLFFWLFFGMLLTAAALHWLPETDFETTAE